MLKRILVVMFLYLWANTVLVGQDAKIAADKSNPAANETVVLEVNISPDKNIKIVWSADGEGEFLTATRNVSRVQFRPSTPGSTVIIVCNISTPKGQERPSIKLAVAGQTPASTNAAPKLAGARVADQAKQSGHPSAAGDLALNDMEYMVPSGYMGDAMSDNNEAATLDAGYGTGCLGGSTSCARIEYKPKDGKVGWAAFAWQRVTEGSANWGESPGADFSHGGFRSVRVFAKGQPDDSGKFPKVQFKSGGNVAPKFNAENRATYTVSGPTVQLTSAFTDFCVSLEGKDLANTVSPFTVVVTKVANPRGAVILLDNIRFSKEACR